MTRIVSITVCIIALFVTGGWVERWGIIRLDNPCFRNCCVNGAICIKGLRCREKHPDSIAKKIGGKAI